MMPGMKKRMPILLILLVLSLSACASCQESDLNLRARKEMVLKQIEWRGISDKNLINAMLRVPREEFVLPEHRKFAYDDVPCPIGMGETMDRPYDAALMISAIQVGATDRVLEVGTGSGYLAAILSEIVKEVYTIEIEEGFAKQATARLKQLGYTNVFVKHGDGFIGWKEHAPFDAVVLGVSPDKIPIPLIKQLKTGGRLVVPLGGDERFQELQLYQKENGKLVLKRRLAPAQVSPMKGEIEKQ